MSHEPTEHTITQVREGDLEALLVMMRAYCDFYEAAPGDGGLLALARALIAAPERHGLQLIARERDREAVGFATLFWTWDTLAAGEIGLMNDLYVVPSRRGRGVGRSLIEACLGRCRERGVARMDWQTAPENAPAQRLYDTLGAEREEAIVYALALRAPPAHGA
jgi:GNAT superfamily N-acetyltransferase